MTFRHFFVGNLWKCVTLVYTKRKNFWYFHLCTKNNKQTPLKCWFLIKLSQKICVRNLNDLFAEIMKEMRHKKDIRKCFKVMQSFLNSLRLCSYKVKTYLKEHSKVLFSYSRVLFQTEFKFLLNSDNKFKSGPVLFMKF